MAVETPCQTPGCVFTIHQHGDAITVRIELPAPLATTEAEAELLEANIHNALELALAPWFRPAKYI